MVSFFPFPSSLSWMFPYSNRQEDDQAKTVQIVKRLVKKGELLTEDAETT